MFIASPKTLALRQHSLLDSFFAYIEPIFRLPFDSVLPVFITYPCLHLQIGQMAVTHLLIVMQERLIRMEALLRDK